MGVLEYRQVDVFAEAPLSGNGLAVVITERPLDASFMQSLTRELRQFETIFLVQGDAPASFDARVFTMEEELPFAGHPSLGAAAVLHERAGGNSYECCLRLAAGAIVLTSRRMDAGYRVAMHQGPPVFGDTIPATDEVPWLSAFGLTAEHRDRRMPLCVASTGLPYLVIPVTGDALEQARISVGDLESRLAAIGAKFAYIFDLERREGRTWDNAGLVEDIATGSAAGPVAGLLVQHGLAEPGEAIVIRQGRFVERPSEMVLEARGDRSTIADILLSGSVCMVALGRFDAPVAR